MGMVEVIGSGLPNAGSWQTPSKQPSDGLFLVTVVMGTRPGWQSLSSCNLPGRPYSSTGCLELEPCVQSMERMRRPSSCASFAILTCPGEKAYGLPVKPRRARDSQVMSICMQVNSLLATKATCKTDKGLSGFPYNDSKQSQACLPPVALQSSQNILNHLKPFGMLRTHQHSFSFLCQCCHVLTFCWSSTCWTLQDAPLRNALGSCCQMFVTWCPSFRQPLRRERRGFSHPSKKAVATNCCSPVIRWAGDLASKAASRHVAFVKLRSLVTRKCCAFCALRTKTTTVV